METNSDDDFTFETPDDKVAQGCSNIIVVGCGGIIVFAAWTVGTSLALYGSFASTNNSWAQNFTSNIAATLLMFPLAPILFALWGVRGWLVLLSILAATGLLVGSWFLEGAWQQLVIGVGSGVFLLLFLDFLIKRGWDNMIKGLQQKAKEAGAKPTAYFIK